MPRKICLSFRRPSVCPRPFQLQCFLFFLFCNWGHLTEVLTGSAFEAMSIPFAFQTQAGSRARISHVRNLTKLIMSILSRNFPIGHLVQIYNRVDRPAMRLCYQEAVSYYCSVIVGKPYLTILRGSSGYRDSLALSAQALCRTRA